MSSMAMCMQNKGKSTYNRKGAPRSAFHFILLKIIHIPFILTYQILPYLLHLRLHEVIWRFHSYSYDLSPCHTILPTSSKHQYETLMILFAEILKETRNIVLHEGDFWSIQLFNSREDCGLLSSIQSKKTNIKNEIKNIQLQYCDEESKVYFEKHDSLIKLLNSSSELVYFFNTTIDFKKFTAIFVRACVNFITNYINTNLSTTEGR